MDKNFIEMRSIVKLEDTLTRTERIQPSIQKCDKVPSWDGELIIYNSKEINKSNILGNIRIQVKGTMQSEIDKTHIMYSVEKSDLLNYQKDGGCVFFVVYMKDIDDYYIYYNAFLPYDLKLILDDMDEDQKTKSIEFIKYPKEDIDLQLKIFRSYVFNRSKQIGTVGATFKIKEMDAEKASMIDGFNFTVFQTGTNPEDMFRSSFKLPTYVYANVMKGKLSVPVQKMKIEEITTGDIYCEVCLDGKCYFNGVRVKLVDEDELLLFGKSFACSKKDEKMSFKIRGKLSERIKDLNFLLALSNSKKKLLTIEGYYRAEFDTEEFLQNNEEYKSTLLYLGIVQAALRTLGVEEDLDCDNLTKQDEWMLEILLKSVIHGQLLVSEEKIPLVINIKISNIVVPVIVKEIQENAYHLKSLFNEKNVIISSSNGEMISVHLAMKEDDFLIISNINYKLIENEIMQQEFTLTLNEAITMFLLNGLMAFDKNQNKKLIDMLIKISDWQIEHHDGSINILNNYQMKKRIRKFSLEEIQKLNRIKANETESQILLGASILLNSKSEIELYWDNLEEDEKELFRKYPIYHLLEK